MTEVLVCPDGSPLTDDVLDAASDEGRHFLYHYAAAQYAARIALIEEQRGAPEDAARALARSTGKNVTFIPAVEVDASYLFTPLTQEEILEISSWTVD